MSSICFISNNKFKRKNSSYINISKIDLYSTFINEKEKKRILYNRSYSINYLMINSLSFMDYFNFSLYIDLEEFDLNIENKNERKDNNSENLFKDSYSISKTGIRIFNQSFQSSKKNKIKNLLMVFLKLINKKMYLKKIKFEIKINEINFDDYKKCPFFIKPSNDKMIFYEGKYINLNLEAFLIEFKSFVVIVKKEYIHDYFKVIDENWGLKKGILKNNKFENYKNVSNMKMSCRNKCVVC